MTTVREYGCYFFRYFISMLYREVFWACMGYITK